MVKMYNLRKEKTIEKMSTMAECGNSKTVKKNRPIS